MSYKVIHYFTDLQDFNHPYNEGDIFPRSGLKVSDARIKELASSANKQKKPLIIQIEDKKEFVEAGIEAINDEETVKEPVFTKTIINRMSTADLQKLAVDSGIENAEEMTGADLKKLLIEKFNL